MKILISSTYFEPYRSGLSVYAFRLAEGLANLGHQVRVLTSQYQPDLPAHEELGALQITRVPVARRLSKGVLMPEFQRQAAQLVGWADVVNPHLPQFEAIQLSRLCRRAGKPLLVTYHCDLVMKGGWFDHLAGWGTTQLQRPVLKQAGMIVQNTRDYAESSPQLRHWLAKVHEVPTPVSAKALSTAEVQAFKEKFGLTDNIKILGLAGRAAAEKGYEYLFAALPQILKKYPETVVVHGGGWQSVIGEEEYQRKIEALAAPFGAHWRQLGFLPDDAFHAFLAASDVLVFSSLNATESFGIVQIEAMLQGTPIVATDLPGVRQPVLQTGFGKIIPARDPRALAEAVCALLENKPASDRVDDYLAQFQTGAVARKYENLFEQLIHE